MNVQKIFLVLFFGLLSGLLSAQKFDLGKVTIAELEEKSHPLEPDAVAAILFEDGATYMEYDINDGFILITEVEVRIKIYSKEGYEWANKQVGYFIGENPHEKVQFSKAITYNLVNGAIEKTKLKSEGEFELPINKFWSAKKITMPNVKEGSVIEYKYRIESPYKTNFPRWNFQYHIPVNSSKYVTKIPEFYIYKANLRGYIFPKKTESTAPRSVSITSKERTHSNNAKNTTFTQEKIEYVDKITTYTAENLPSLKDEDFVNNIDNYTASVEHELSMTKFKDAPVKSFSTTWDDVVKSIYNIDSFGGELKKNNYFEAELTPLLAPLKTREEKVAVIFNHVKGTMNWNGLSGYTCDEGVKKAYKSKVGNTAEINLMLVAMLRYAGVEASPVLVSTRSNGISIFPSVTSFNYVIAAVEVQGALIYLDATDKFTLPDILPIKALNWTGRLVRADGSSTIVDLMPKTNSKEIVNLIATFDAEGKLTGKVRNQYFDYNAFLHRSSFNKLSDETYLEKLEQDHNGIEITDFKNTKENDLAKPVVESYSFTHNTTAEIIGGKMYFSPLLFFRKERNPFIEEKREYPIDFMFPYQDKYSFTISIPDGYEVESVPEPIALVMGDNFGSYKFTVTATAKQIQVLNILEINEAIIAPQEYATLQAFYKQMLEKQNEKIVLKKV